MLHQFRWNICYGASGLLENPDYLPAYYAQLADVWRDCPDHLAIVRESAAYWGIAPTPPESAPAPEQVNEPARSVRAGTKREPTPDGLLLPPQAADKLNVTIEQLMGFVLDGELRYVNTGRGKKRPRYAFTDVDINELIERRQTREVPCPSTSQKSPRRFSGSTSKSVVVGFTAQRAARLAAKRNK
jgi:hypothetical protein